MSQFIQCVSDDVRTALYNARDSTPEQVARYFKTSKGSYASFDQFLGVRHPTVRKIAKQFISASETVLTELLSSLFNEERLLALMILVLQYARADPVQKEKIYLFYVDNIKFINNWNLIDISAPHILGEHLWDKDRQCLFDFAKSKFMWERRVAILSTWAFIKRQDFNCTIEISLLLLQDKQDLIHKAVGWMLRELGKRNEALLMTFIEQHYQSMPRTMLRYAIERFEEHKRQDFLQKR